MDWAAVRDHPAAPIRRVAAHQVSWGGGADERARPPDPGRRRTYGMGAGAGLGRTGTRATASTICGQ